MHIILISPDLSGQFDRTKNLFEQQAYTCLILQPITSVQTPTLSVNTAKQMRGEQRCRKIGFRSIDEINIVQVEPAKIMSSISGFITESVIK